MAKTKKSYIWDGVTIRKARERAGMTRTELAAACGVTEGTVRSWEENKSAPHLPTYLRACRALDKDPEALLATA